MEQSTTGIFGHLYHSPEILLQRRIYARFQFVRDTQDLEDLDFRLRKEIYHHYIIPLVETGFLGIL